MNYWLHVLYVVEFINDLYVGEGIGNYNQNIIPSLHIDTCTYCEMNWFKAHGC